MEKVKIHLQQKNWSCHLKSLPLQSPPLPPLTFTHCLGEKKKKKKRNMLATLHLLPNEARTGSDSMCFPIVMRKQLSCCRLLRGWADLMPPPAGRAGGGSRRRPLSAIRREGTHHLSATPHTRKSECKQRGCRSPGLRLPGSAATCPN